MKKTISDRQVNSLISLLDDFYANPENQKRFAEWLQNREKGENAHDRR